MNRIINVNATHTGVVWLALPILGLTLKLKKIPKVRCGAFIGFDNLHDAATATIALVRASLSTLCRCELLNGDGVTARARHRKQTKKVITRGCLFERKIPFAHLHVLRARVVRGCMVRADEQTK